MERDSLRSITSSIRETEGEGLLRTAAAAPESSARQTTSDFILQWGNRKRLRCMKVKNDTTAAVHRVDRRLARAASAANNTSITGGYFNLRHRPSPPPPPPPPLPLPRVLRNSENYSAMRGQSNGGLRRLASPDRDNKRSTNHHHHNGNHENNKSNNNIKSAISSEAAHDGKKGGGCGSSSGSGDAAAAAAAWPPKFVIALTNKEKEEDFYAFKGSKLPQRPKKRAKFIQRTLNLVSPGAWLCDLTLERYEVREKKISKKRPRGLKAMGNMDSDSE